MKKVACIVVTYNRLSLLKECIESLRKQTNKDFDIIVVNNGSTDGTEEWLSQQTDVKPITQANVGGAGGFYTGMKTAFESGYEWIWMMDDDGLADSHQLDNLLVGAKDSNSLFVNALVCNVKDHDKLAFGLVYDGAGISSVEDAQKVKYISDSINPFNGTLINKKVIEKIGFIKKEMFIWGDEMEYTFRAKKNGFNVGTITEAIHYHPVVRLLPQNIIPFWDRYTLDVPSDLERAFIKYRNKGYNCKNYYPEDKFKICFKYIAFYLLRFNFKGLYCFIKAFRDGEKNKY